MQAKPSVSEAIALLQREGYEVVKREGLLSLSVQQVHRRSDWDTHDGLRPYTWARNADLIGRYMFREKAHLFRQDVIYPDDQTDPMGYPSSMAVARTTLDFYPAQAVEFRR